jgi:hypothetical protein
MLMTTLQRALSVKRPHGGAGVADFTEWLATAVPEYLQEKTWVDTCGNLHVDARTTALHKTLFVAHVDTVHRVEGANPIIKEKNKKAHIWRAAPNSCLGADDGAGVALLMHMMHEGVAGYYVFTQGEECGGIGAKHIAKYNPELLDQFDRAIAFDRRGTDSVITHQGYGRCCSDTFGQALAGAINGDDYYMMYTTDDSGVYTDTAEFVDNIPECTNISTGYYNEHGDREYLDVAHFQALSLAILMFDWDTLPVERDPKVSEVKSWGTGVYDYGVYTYNDALHGDQDFEMDDIRYALMDARDGYTDELFYLVGESVYPDDPEQAVKFLDARRLTDDVIDKMMDLAKTYDATTLLCTVFDTLYKE